MSYTPMKKVGGGQYTFTGSGACSGKTFTINKDEKLCIVNCSIPISRFPTVSDTLNSHNNVIGTIPNDVLPSETVNVNLQTNLYGDPKDIVYLSIYSDGTVSAFCKGTYENGMTIRGQLIWFAQE